MSSDNAATRQIKSADVHSKIQANLEQARVLSKAAGEIEEKLLGTTTPWPGENAKDQPEPPGFLDVISSRLSTLHAELLHLKDVLKSINSEF